MRFAKHPAIFVLLTSVIAINLTACHPPGPGAVHVRLSGAQVPTEFVASWLESARPARFSSEKIWPLAYSDGGLQKLATGECEIACTDRPITPRELPQFGEKRIRGHRVAFYGFALYIHPDNPLDAIYSRHMEMILQEKITDWSQLAGDQLPELEGPIRVYGASKSTRAGMHLSHFARIFMSDPTWTVLDTDAEIVAAVAADPLALGFAGVGLDHDVRYLRLRMNRTGPASAPSIEEIESERYGLAKVMYVYHEEPASPAVQAVLDYLYSEQGQAVIESTDVWPINRQRAEVPLPTP